ncbi:MAG: ABC transporter permease [Candidatus Omnitrophica bacterium]|nr:ABC transporter permease [Candidatus Omnitrophota bacterium]
MVQYLARRLLSLIPLLIGITLITFFVIHLAPGRPTDVLTDLNPKISLQARDRLAKIYGLDQPLPAQYLQWLSRMGKLDFGRSFVDDRSVWDKIAERIPVTLMINLLAMALVFVVAVPLGVFGAVRQGSFWDHWITLFVFVGFATPTFWLALLLMQWLGIQLGWLPLSGIVSLDFERMNFWEKVIDVSRHLTLPVFISAFGGLAGISRYMKTSMSEILRQDFIRTARAKGLSERQVLYKHALRNALLPIVTILGLSVPGLLGGSVIFESIFAIPGLGRLFYDGVMARDYPVVMGILTIGAVLTLLGNLLADLGYAWVDPRIRVGEKG